MKANTNTSEERARLAEAAIDNAYGGSGCLYRHPAGMIFTDGIKNLAEAAGAFWLIDAAAFFQPELMRQKEFFQCWKLTVKGQIGTLEAWSDTPGDIKGGSRRLVRMKIPYTDFPLPEFEFWVETSGPGQPPTMMIKTER